MIDRFSNLASVCLHFGLVAMLAQITFNFEEIEPPESGMEFQVIDIEYAMPSTSPILAGNLPLASKSPQKTMGEPRDIVAIPDSVFKGQQTAETATSSQSKADGSNFRFLSDPVSLPGLELELTADTGASIEVPTSSVDQVPAQRSERFQSRLDAAALSRASSISTASQERPSRLNSAALGAAIGRATPIGLPSLTVRQKVDLAQKVREQVMPCWNPPPSNSGAASIVRLRVRLDRQGGIVGQPIQSAVVGQNDENASYVTLLINSGRRAIMLCAPLDLPPELYDAWAEVEVEFDPRNLR
ncbi:TonB C-terminal domain-containing protein [Erythrobacter aurantius]|uniref:TonB C-terminal domain-containing protein n=1 Tax=Erythrobacter aurantius TaxID=2909249 RepID=UPI0020797601|nr:TonB C-terminal domain-containing protein [Erythrobacter aurantius]